MAVLPKLTVSIRKCDRTKCPVSDYISMSYECYGEFDLSHDQVDRRLACQSTPSSAGIRLSLLFAELRAGETHRIAANRYQRPPRSACLTAKYVRNRGETTANRLAWSYCHPDVKVKGDTEFPQKRATARGYRGYICESDAAKGKVRDGFIDDIAPPSVTVG